MDIEIIHVGRLRHESIQRLVREYSQRLDRYVSTFDLRSVPKSESDDKKVVRREESEHLRDALGDGVAVAMDENGREFSSTGFAKKMRQWLVGSIQTVSFVIGGAYGLPRDFRRECTTTMSLSPMTFPHQLATLVLTEQVYRAFTILKGEPYHKA